MIYNTKSYKRKLVMLFTLKSGLRLYVY